MTEKLFDSERKVMEVLWREGDMTAGRLAKILKEEIGWNRNTTYTVIKKCVEKGAIERQEPNFFCKSDDARTPLMWAKSGLGVAVVPKSISMLVEKDGLVSRDIACKELVTRTAAVYKKSGYISEIGKTFVEFWVEKYRG